MLTNFGLFRLTGTVVGTFNRQLRAWLKARGVAFTPIDTPGMHTWLVWRGNLAAFAPLLFQKNVR